MAFHDCCCGPPPPPCDCACVCPYAWWITNPYQFDEQGKEKYIGIFREGPLVGNFGLGDWTLLWWTDGCLDQGEDGWIYHLANDDRLPQSDVEVWIGDGNTGIGLVSQAYARSVPDPFGDGSAQFQAIAEFPIASAGCKMFSVRYQRVNFWDPDCSEFLVPELQNDVYVPGPPQQHYQGNPNTPNFIDCVDLDNEDKAVFGDDSTSYIGNAFPLDDPRFITFPGYLNERYFNGCISMFTVYNRRLSDTELDDMWNNGAGKLPTNAYEYWCALNPPWQDTAGQLRNIIAEHIGAVWDQNGEHILDGQGNRIHGIAGQG